MSTTESPALATKPLRGRTVHGVPGSPQDQSRHKIIDHPDVGLIALAVVLGTQALID